MWYNISKKYKWLRSSVVERSPVKRVVAGSNPAVIAKFVSNSPGVLWCNTDSMLSYKVGIEYVLRS